ncbi:MAG: hypothetical protein V7607_5466 [Solirubrobacteraceae bacterium]
MTRRVTVTLAAAALMIAGSGCGLAHNDSDGSKPTPDAPPARTQSTPRAASNDEAAQAAPAKPAEELPEGGETTARRALERFARLWTNWTWKTLAAQERGLRPLASGELRGELDDAARASERNALLKDDEAEQRGDVVAVDVKPGATRREAITVVHETAIVHGHVTDHAERYRVYQATVVRGRDGWLVEQWNRLDS